MTKSSLDQPLAPRVELDRLLATCLNATEAFQRFLDDIHQAPSEDFLIDRIDFGKEAEKFNAFDVGFGRMMDGRELNEDWRCLQGLRTALSGLLLLLQENCYNVDAPAMEELAEEFAEWVEQDGAEIFAEVHELVEELKTTPAVAYIEECTSPFIAPQYTPSDVGSDLSLSSASDNSDADYMTPLQSRVSSFGTVYSDSDGGHTKPDHFVDLTSVIERFGVYNKVLMESLELVEGILKWNYDSNLSKFEVMTGAKRNKALVCTKIQCEEVFSHSEAWRTHVEHCRVEGLSFFVPTARTPGFETLTLKCAMTACAKPFSSWEKLRQHQDSAHKVFTCSLSTCGVGFFDWELGKEHVQVVHRGMAGLLESWTPSDLTKMRGSNMTFFPDHTVLFNLRCQPPKSLRSSSTMPMSPTSAHPPSGDNGTGNGSGPGTSASSGSTSNFNELPTPQEGFQLFRSRSTGDFQLSAAPKPHARKRIGLTYSPPSLDSAQGTELQRSKSAPGMYTGMKHQKSRSYESFVMVVKGPKNGWGPASLLSFI